MPRAVSSSRSIRRWRSSSRSFSSASILSRACSMTAAELAPTIASSCTSSAVHCRPGAAEVTAIIPVTRLSTRSGTASTERMRLSAPRRAGKRGSFARSGVASGSRLVMRKPMTFRETAAGHDPAWRPGRSLRISVLAVGASVSGSSSRIEPSSAENIPVVLRTTQSRIGCSSECDATTWHSSYMNDSSERSRRSVSVGACGSAMPSSEANGTAVSRRIPCVAWCRLSTAGGGSARPSRVPAGAPAPARPRPAAGLPPACSCRASAAVPILPRSIAAASAPRNPPGDAR
jgi:hypothetical protein